ncbi:MAG: hypothetical protein PHQ58_04620 [Rhodoferax sp.]|uniref:hypothetical protein n=1 Tax=Rhodoferax sp. TaxID=50421 RepID=UPI00263366D7|nr:hypothetical protein [Rhodoferax sp.]MDD2879700.1 hypothetical protein [Rhodoferax sp.]
MLKLEPAALDEVSTEEGRQGGYDQSQEAVTLAYTATNDEYLIMALGRYRNDKFFYRPTAELIEKIRSRQCDSFAVVRRLAQLGWETWCSKQHNQVELELAMTTVVAKMVEHIRRPLETPDKSTAHAKANIPGVFATVSIGKVAGQQLDTVNKATQEWTMQAAKGMCAWICSDCCASFPEGMPDACAHGHQGCTDIIQRDKRIAGS